METQFTRNRITRRRLLKSAAVMGGLGAASAIVAACAPASSTPASSTPTATPTLKAPVTLRIAMTGPVAQKVWTAAAPVFESQSPLIKVTSENMEFADYTQKLQLMFASGTPPDIFVAFSSDGPTFAGQNAIAPLEGILKKEDYVSSIYGLGQYQGKQYFVPWAANIRSFFWRKDQYTEAGLDPERPPQTLEELRDHAIKLTKRDPQGNITRSGFSVYSDRTFTMDAQFYAFLRRSGGEFFTADGTGVQFSGEAGVSALQYLVDLVRTHKVDVGGAVHDDNNDLAQGKTGSVINGDWVVRNIQNIDNVGVASPPSGKQYFSELGGDCLFVSSKTKNLEEVGVLLRFLLTADNSVAYAKGKGRAIPVAASAAQSDYMKDPFLKQIAAVAAKSSPLPVHAKWNEIWQSNLRGNIQDAILGKKTAKQALDDGATAALAILKK